MVKASLLLTNSNVFFVPLSEFNKYFDSTKKMGKNNSQC